MGHLMRAEGIGEDFVPAIAGLSAVRHAYSISDQESFDTARELLRAERLFGGSSTGTLLAASFRYCREQKLPKRVVSFVCDTGTDYLSKMYNDHWLIDQGLLRRPAYGDLRDLVARRFEEGAVVSVTPGDTLQTVFQRMRYAEVSQLPVIDGGRIVGLVDESDPLLRVQADSAAFRASAATAMTQSLEMLSREAGLDALQRVLEAGLVAIIADDHRFYGLVTRFDRINHLRKKFA